MVTDNEIKKGLLTLFYSYFSEEAYLIEPITNSASNRSYYKIQSENNTAIGTHCINTLETEAFEHLTTVFRNLQLPVPEIYVMDYEKKIYLQEFLAESSLFQIITKLKETPDSEDEILTWYKKVIDWLLCFQIKPYESIDYSKCFPVSNFNETSIGWDLNYFKYYFLLPHFTQLNELKLETGYQKIIDFITKIESQYFMYRDFQSRNILVNNKDLYFIDYQGGRKGPLYYDLVSLLLQAQINLKWEQRFYLMEYYRQQLMNFKIVISKDIFENHFLIFALLRTFQVLGAYGYRGIIERKKYFIKSIPYALSNLAQIKRYIEHNKALNIPYIFEMIDILIENYTNNVE